VVIEMNSDDRSQTAKAIGWVNQIITASLVLVLPVVAGNWLDRTFHASPLYLVLGALLGFVAAGWHFYKIIVAISKDEAD
jgi:F0F1-type ATP synthase assembly protein I